MQASLDKLLAIGSSAPEDEEKALAEMGRQLALAEAKWAQAANPQQTPAQLEATAMQKLFERLRKAQTVPSDQTPRLIATGLRLLRQHADATADRLSMPEIRNGASARAGLPGQIIADSDASSTKLPARRPAMERETEVVGIGRLKLD